MIQFSTGLRNALLNNSGLAQLLSGAAAGGAVGGGTATLYFFAGTIPANPDAALDMSGTHTLLGTVQNRPTGGGTVTGLSFASPANGVLSNTAGENWSTGAMTFSGAQAASTTLQATFFRLCATGDNGQTAGTSTSYRIQGTVGQDASYDAKLTNAIFAAGSTETLSSFQYQEGNY